MDHFSSLSYPVISTLSSISLLPIIIFLSYIFTSLFIESFFSNYKYTEVFSILKQINKIPLPFYLWIIATFFILLFFFKKSAFCMQFFLLHSLIL